MTTSREISHSDCAFCSKGFTLEELATPAKVHMLFCGHRVHFACKDAWVKAREESCPTCASTIHSILILPTDSLSSLYDRVSVLYQLNRAKLQLISNSKVIPDSQSITVKKQNSILDSQIWAIQMRHTPFDPLIPPLRVFLYCQTN